MKLLGGLPRVLSNSTWLAEESREIPAHAAFLPTSSSELTLCTMDSGYSHWTTVYTELLFPAL